VSVGDREGQVQSAGAQHKLRRKPQNGRLRRVETVPRPVSHSGSQRARRTVVPVGGREGRVPSAGALHEPAREPQNGWPRRSLRPTGGRDDETAAHERVS